MPTLLTMVLVVLVEKMFLRGFPELARTEGIQFLGVSALQPLGCTPIPLLESPGQILNFDHLKNQRSTGIMLAV